MAAKILRGMEFLFVATLLCGQVRGAGATVKPDELPKAVTATLTARFPNLKIVSAEKETEGGVQIYDIELTQKGRKFEADIREDGTMLEIEKRISEKHWPNGLIATVKAEHPNSSIVEVMEIFKVSGKAEMPHHFEVTLKTEDKKDAEFLFSLDGKPMKEEAAATSGAASDENVKNEDLPPKVKAALHSKFPAAEIGKAEKGKEEGQEIYEVSIKDKKHNIDVTLTPDGKILGFEKTISKSEQPKAMAETLNAKYPSATVKLTEEVWEHDKLTGYEVTLITADKKTLELMFDPKGKLVSDKKED